MSAKIYIYRLNQEEVAIETMEKDGEEISAAAHWILPSEEFYGLWENLFYEIGVKENVSYLLRVYDYKEFYSITKKE